MANKETRVLKSNTFEEFRQKTNEVSLHLGDNEQLNISLSDKTFNFDNVSAGDIFFEGLDDNTKTVKFEIKPEESVDNTGGYIILTGSPTITGFDAGNTLTQSGGYSATIVSASTGKILVKNSSGTFDPSSNILAGTDTILAANVVRIIAEAYPVGVVRVYVNNTEISQNLQAGGFHVGNYAGYIPLSNSPDVTNFTEGTTIYQGSNIGTATFSGTVLSASSTLLRLKTQTGSFNGSTQIKIDGSSSTITGANHGDITLVDSSFGNIIELNTPSTANDDIRIYSPSIVDAVNELQDDVGITENLTTVSGNLVGAVNEIEAVFDASTHEISAGSTAFNVTSGEFTIDSSADIVLDADGGNVELKDNGVQYASLTNTSGNIIVKSGTTTMLTGSGADATFANDVTVTRDVDVDRNLNVDGATTLDGTTIDGNLDLNGNVDVSGTSTLHGAVELNSTLGVDGNFRIGAGNSSKFDVAAATGNTQIDGTLEVDGTAGIDGDLRVGTNKFNVTASSGNTQIDGTLNVDGATTLNGTTIDGNLDLNGSVDVSTNAVIHGTLDVDGATTLDGTTIDGNLDLNGNADISTNLTVGGVLDIGTLNSKFTNTNNVKLALNELHDELGNAVITGSGTPAAGQSNITNAVNAIDAEIGSTNYIGSTISFALDAAQDYLGTYSNTVSSTITGALNQLHTEIGSSALVDNLPSDYAYNVTDHTTAINTLSTFVGNTSIANIGATDTVTGALQKLHAEIGDSNLSVFAASDISAALRELESEKVYLNSSTQQEIVSKLGFTGDITFKNGGSNADTMTFNTGTVLDVSNASILLPGNSSNVSIFSTAFLEVDGNIESPMGFSVDRQHVTAISDTADVRVQWNENHADGTSASKPARGWQLQGLDDASASHTTDIVTFYNAKELITSNTESGINVTWDATNENFDFNVNDPTIQLSGDVAGSAVMTNLGSINISTTIQPNSVALTTDTTGDYIRTLTGTNNQITVLGSGTEGRAATLSIPTDFRMPGTARVLSTAGSSSATTGALTVAGGVGIGEDLYIAGNLYVEGTRTELNVTTLEVEDTLILAGNNLVSEPSSGGFGIETGPITNPSGVASNVTGAHSIVYNYGTDRWEADGSLILSEATLGSPTIEGNTFAPSNNLDFIGGTGISVSTAVNGTDIDVTITNTLDGYSGWFLSTQGTDRGNIADDERVDFHGGTALTATYDTTNNNRVIFNHDNVGPGAQTFGQPGGEDGTYVKSVTINNQGHITGVTTDDFDDRYDNYGSWTIRDGDTTSYTITSGDTLQIASGNSGIVSNFTADDVLSISHADTSSVVNLSQDNSGNTFIQDLAFTFDTFGHVTGATASTGSVSIGNGQLSVSGTTGLAGSGTFTANQAGNSSITLTNTDRGSAQNIFKNVQADSGVAVADNNNDTLTLSGGTNIQTSVSGDTITITNTYSHPSYNGDDFSIDTGPLTGATVISDLDINVTTDTLGSVVDANGTVATRNLTLADLGYTGVTNADRYSSWQLYVNNVSQDSITSGERVGFDAGGAISLSWDGNDLTISHADTSSQGSVNNSGNTFIQDISLDTYGHVTSISSATVSIGNGQIDGRTAGLGLSGSMDATANQSGNTTFTVTSNATTAATANTIAYRDSGGDIHARLFRSEYDSTNSNIGFIMTQVNTASDNYMRPSTPAQVRTALNVANGANAYVLPTGNVTGASVSGQTLTLNRNGQSNITFTNTDTNTNNYTNSASFNASNGIISFSGPGLSYSVDIDGRYVTSSGVTSVATGNGLTGGTITSSGTLSMSGSYSGTFTASGDVVAYSDERLKNNIETLDGSKVFDMRGVSFTRNDEDDRQSSGVIAQELEKLAPELITENDEGIKGVSYGNLTGYLIEAIKLLKEENSQIREELETLKSINR